MKKLLGLFLVLLVAIGLGFLIHQDPGYAMVSYDHWLIATSIWVAVATLLLGFIVLYCVIRLFSNIFSIPRRLARRRKYLHLLRNQKYLIEGIEHLMSGEYKKAEKCFLKSGEKNMSYVNYLLAAKAASGEDAVNRGDEYLKKARALKKDAGFVISLTEAKMFMQADQTDAALPIYKSLLQQEPKNPLVLSGLKSIYFKTRQWESLKLLLPQLKKQKLISSDEINLMNHR
jgi:HemY protein